MEHTRRVVLARLFRAAPCVFFCLFCFLRVLSELVHTENRAQTFVLCLVGEYSAAAQEIRVGWSGWMEHERTSGRLLNRIGRY